MQINAEPTDFIAALSRNRQQLWQHVGSILSPDAQSNADTLSEPVIRLSQALMAALEQLKAAEEELLNQHLERLTMIGEHERHAAHLRSLFDMAPVALIMTASDGTIRAANAAASDLVKWSVHHLVGKTMAAIVGRDLRPAFREQLRHAIEMGGVDTWALTLERHTDGPIRVDAAVKVVPDAATNSRAIFWTFRPATS